MNSIDFRIGRVRFRVFRLFQGGLCPLNVMGKNWSIVPHFSSQRKAEDQSEIDLLPAAAGTALLSLIRRVLGNQKETNEQLR